MEILALYFGHFWTVTTYMFKYLASLVNFTHDPIMVSSYIGWMTLVSYSEGFVLKLKGGNGNHFANTHYIFSIEMISNVHNTLNNQTHTALRTSIMIITCRLIKNNYPFNYLITKVWNKCLHIVSGNLKIINKITTLKKVVKARNRI